MIGKQSGNSKHQIISQDLLSVFKDKAHVEELTFASTTSVQRRRKKFIRRGLAPKPPPVMRDFLIFCWEEKLKQILQNCLSWDAYLIDLLDVLFLA